MSDDDEYTYTPHIVVCAECGALFYEPTPEQIVDFEREHNHAAARLLEKETENG